MSLQRSLRRAALRRNGVEPKSGEPVYRYRADGGYDVLHPTRGWRRFSVRRLQAEMAMGYMLGGGRG